MGASTVESTQPGIAHHGATGIAWAYISFFGEKLIVFGTTAVLARFLVPEEFGLIAAVLLFLGIAEYLRDFGLRDALIFLGEADGTSDTAFWLNVMLGVLLTAIVVLVSPAAGKLFEAPEFGQLLAWMSPFFLISSLGSTHEAILQRRLLFARRYAVDFLAALVKGVLSLVLVVGGLGIWGVVYAFLAGAVVRTAGRWIALSWRPRVRLEATQARALLGYGKSIVVVTLIDVPLLMADQIAITLLLGQTALAYYYIATRIPDVAIMHVNLVATRVVFPIFASLKDDPRRLSESILETARYTSLAVVPMSLGLAAVADLAIPAVFGWQWTPSVPMLVVLSLIALAAALVWSIGDGMKAIGRPDILARLTVLELTYFPALVFGGVWWIGEPIGACLGSLAGFVITDVIRLIVARHVIGIRALDYLACYRSALLAAVVMLAAVFAARTALAGADLWLRLIASITIGAVAYLTAIWNLERQRILKVITLLGGVRATLQPASGDLCVADVSATGDSASLP